MKTSDKANSRQTQKFEELWDELLTKSPSPDHFLHLARVVLPLQERAWKKWVETNPSESTLSHLLRADRVDEYRHMRKLIGQVLIKNYPKKDVLLSVLKEVPEFQTEVVEALCLHVPNKHEIWEYVITRIDNAVLQERTARIYLAQQLPNSSLCVIISRVPALREEAGRKLLLQHPAGEEPVVIMRDVPALAQQAWEMVKREGDVNALVSVVGQVPMYKHLAGKLLIAKTFEASREFYSTLFQVVKHVPELREEVWEKLTTITLPNEWLEAIAGEAPELAERVLALRTTPERTVDVIMSEIFNANTCG
ncbi:MAG: hypothetical protein UY50_C0016G0011 [Parcubacteria group bacterium GW2011_GWA2_49_9]|nr:MAG: hypothetical protein UY50_C0016G0011 [Parcubacteria group bacterium GW2011_GWA2_49_9]